MLLLPLILVGWAAGQSLEDIRALRCFTRQGKLSDKVLSCSVPIPSAGNCSELAHNEDISVGRERDRQALFQDGLARSSDNICSVSYRGRCGRNCGPIEKLCFTIIQQSASYPDALSDCANRGSHIFIPDNDEDLQKLLKLIDGKIKRFWIGGGTTFYRTCNRVKPNEEGVEPAVTFTVEDRNRKGVLGYVRTRLATEKFPYICAKSSHDVKPAECLRIAQSGPIVTDCKMQPTTMPGGASTVMGCMPAGPLRIGETLTIHFRQPVDPTAWWSANFLTATYNVAFHFTVRKSEDKCLASSANGKWGSPFLPEITYHPFPYVPGQISKTTIKNFPNQLLITVDDRYSFAFPHRTSRPNEDYAMFMGINTMNVTVTSGGRLYALPFDGKTVRTVVY